MARTASEAGRRHVDDPAHRPGRAATGSAQVAVTRTPDHLVVLLCGAIDVALADDLRAVEERAGRESVPVVVDASALTYCDATVAGFLRTLSGTGPVTVARPGRLVRDTLTAFGLGDLFQVRLPRQAP